MAMLLGNAFECGWVGLMRRSGTWLEKHAAYPTQVDSPCHFSHIRSSSSATFESLRHRGRDFRLFVCKILYCNVTSELNGMCTPMVMIGASEREPCRELIS